MKQDQLVKEQIQCLELQRLGLKIEQIAEQTKLSVPAVKRRLSGAKKKERLDPELAAKLQERGIVDLAGLHSGWLMEKDEFGGGQSLYFYLGADEEKISFADAVRDALWDIPRLPEIQFAHQTKDRKEFAKDHASWVAVADLHVGAQYGHPQLEADFYATFDDMVSRMPPAEHAVLMELGDLLDANDHKGVTPASQNPLDVQKDRHLLNTQVALKMLRWAAYRLLETHETVELHLIPGNHDRTAYIAVLLALAEHFADNPRMNVVITEEEYRVITWGRCAAFPHHGDTLKWEQLKDVWADQFPDEWAAAKSHRHIMTAHLHHDKRRDLVGAVGEHFRTIQRPSAWAKARGLISRGSLTTMTMHKDRGEQFRTTSNIQQFPKENS